MNKVHCKSIIAAALLLLVCPIALRAQSFQPLNGDFEQWDGSGSTDEPVHWNSFATSDGSYAGLASDPHHYHRYGGRPGSTGSSYLTIYTRSILGVKANGNMTTGRIHAGSMSASNSNNYNYTQRSEADFSQPFTATPDSLGFWVSFYSKDDSQASLTATIHGDNDFKDPNDLNTRSMYAGTVKVEFGSTTSHPLLPEWTFFKVPVNYNGTAAPAYLLISFTTNKTPGSGNANDSLMIDDIYFIYSSWLTDIKLNGVSLPDFSKGRLDYSVQVSDLNDVSFSCTTEVSDATVAVDSVDVSDSERLYTFTVTAEDGVTQHVYTVEVTTASGPAGISNPEGMRLHVSPNPASSLVCISAEGAPLRQAEVYDMSGRKICDGSVLQKLGDMAESAVFDVSDFAQGTYIVRAVTAQGRVLTTALVKY